MKVLCLWKMVSTVSPAFWLMASAFVYGAKKFGDGTWRNFTAAEHIDLALHELAAWKRGVRDWHALVDAALRMAFAVAQVVPEKAEYKK